MSVLSAGISSIGQILGGIGAKKAAKARARALEARAKMARREGGIRAGLALADGERVSAAAAVRAAANSGGGGITGSALDILADLGAQSMHNARTAIYNAETEATSAENDADVVRKTGSLALTTATIGATASFMSEAASETEKAMTAGGG